MRLTKRQAIKECKELWRAIEKSGLSKAGFLSTPEGKEWLEKQYDSNCPLCHYDSIKWNDGDEGCQHCPLVTKFGETCSHLGYSSVNTNVSHFIGYVNKL